ncbi:hypothetical protein BH23CHL2_BH23CHL2_28440 [soil metagenome]
MAHINRDRLAAQHQPREKLDPEQESFVRDMVLPECCFQPPAVRVFVGYLGLSPRGLPCSSGNGNGSQDVAGMPGEWVRLYRTLDFTDFIEVKWEDVVYLKKSTAALLPIEGTILWVQNDATVWHAQVNSRSATASDFMRGPIAEQQLSTVQQTLSGGAATLVDTPSWGGPC